MLFQNVNLRNLRLDLVLQMFNVYVFPVFRYGAVLWLSSCSEAALSSVDSLFTKYLKRYLGLPKHCNNAIIHLLTDTTPLSHQLRSLAPSFASSLSFPSCLSGLQISLLRDSSSPHAYSPIQSIPTTFWHSRVVQILPSRFQSRRIICRDVTDQVHFDLCTQTTFHVCPDDLCFCKFCGRFARSYHHYECPAYV